MRAHVKWTLADCPEDEHGYFVDPEGCSHDTPEDALSHLLGFCGCGCPEEALGYVRDGLEIVLALQEEVWKKTLTYEEWNARVETHTPATGGRYFFWYWLDSKGLTEHGGSVPGWLTDKGKLILSELEGLELEQGD